MRDLIFVGYIAFIMLMAFKRPFLFTLIYAYVDIVSPQRLSYFLLNSIPLSLILFVLAFLGFLVSDDKKDVRDRAALGAAARVAGLLRIHNDRRRRTCGGARKMELGVEGVGLCRIPAADLAHQIAD